MKRELKVIIKLRAVTAMKTRLHNDSLKPSFHEQAYVHYSKEGIKSNERIAEALEDIAMLISERKKND